MSNLTNSSKRSPKGEGKGRNTSKNAADKNASNKKAKAARGIAKHTGARSIEKSPQGKSTAGKRVVAREHNAQGGEILLGRLQTLRIASFSPHGAYLIAPTPQEYQHSTSHQIQNLAGHTTSSHQFQNLAPQVLTRVLLPNKFLPPNASEGLSVEVFVLHDSEDRPVATTQRPKAQLGDIAALEVVSIEEKGCFLDLGLDKHIFMPSLYPRQFKRGQRVVVFLTQDKQSRLLARLQVKSALKPLRLQAHQKPHELYTLSAQALIFEETPLGFGCAVGIKGDFQTKRDSEKNSESDRVHFKHYGLLYKSELSFTPNIGDELSVKIKSLRRDGKLDLVLLAGNVADSKAEIIKSMPLELDFSSPPEAIFSRFGLSKKLFKRLINELVREGKIEFIPSQRRFVKRLS